MSSHKNRKYCDPFKSHQKVIYKGLRDISERTRSAHASLRFQIGDHLCTSCRKRVTALPVEDAEPSTASDVELSDVGNDNLPSTSSVPNKSDAIRYHKDIFISPDHELSLLNQSLNVLGESPVIKHIL